uniref:Uncharacterized protein n=1 Tax=Oryza meridionalis TaxID=40149 RepID=A0A0E0DVX3_9ORYZ
MVGELLTIGEQTVGLLRIAESQVRRISSLASGGYVQPETQIYVLHTAGCISWKDVGAIAFFGDVQPETQIYVLHTAGCISWKDVGAIAFFGESLVSMTNTTITVALWPDSGMYGPLQDVQEDLINDIFLHDQVKIALRCRAINLELSDTDTTSSSERD